MVGKIAGIQTIGSLSSRCLFSSSKMRILLPQPRCTLLNMERRPIERAFFTIFSTWSNFFFQAKRRARRRKHTFMGVTIGRPLLTTSLKMFTFLLIFLLTSGKLSLGRVGTFPSIIDSFFFLTGVRTSSRWIPNRDWYLLSCHKWGGFAPPPLLLVRSGPDQIYRWSRTVRFNRKRAHLHRRKALQT